MDSASRLDALGAPAELVSWATGRPARRAWRDCPQADWLLWLAAAESLPVTTLVLAAGTCVERAVTALPSGAEPLGRALRAARSLEAADCAAAARACEAARESFPESYRAGRNPGYGAAAHAAAWVARAAEGVVTARARAEAKRGERARELAAIVGSSPDIFVPATPSPPEALDPAAAPGDPVEEELRYAVAAAAQALGEAAQSLAPDVREPEAHERAQAELCEQLRVLLEPLRSIAP
ncbi:MAG: hypothetical protein HY744_33355 [Deltaproteobacteria bacterium]|nr:hypothetical protein [Deltaproteobacteria bacterium]